MKYLFFDIECSNCFNGIGKMVEFGYVLTDENFKILGKREYVMSPGRGGENRFYLKGRKNQKDLELAYDYDYYFEQPEFPAFYEKIRSLIEANDTICFAWSSDNDILHLFHACQRYGKSAMKYICYDVQKIASDYLEINEQMSLKSACNAIVGKGSTVQIQEHLSSDDAKMTMMILEAVCVLERKNSSSLIAESEYAKEDAYDYVLNIDARKNEKQKRKERHQFYKRMVKEDELLLQNPDFKGERYNVSGKIKNKVEDLDSVIEKIHSLGGVVVDNLVNTDLFVTYDEDNQKEIIEKFGDKYSVRYILMSDLMTKDKPEIICVT